MIRNLLRKMVLAIYLSQRRYRFYKIEEIFLDITMKLAGKKYLSDKYYSNRDIGLKYFGKDDPYSSLFLEDEFQVSVKFIYICNFLDDTF